jgi:uncharacterized cupredoxin-like copper-binding protein
MRRVPLLVVVAMLALGACTAGDARPATSKTVTIRHSSFGFEHLGFDRGETVRFVIHNRDPIDHEFIVGDESVQARHEEGRKRHHHGAVPGEISVPAGTTRATTFTFAEAGTTYFACHLPGHYDFGMHGEIDVAP